MSNHAVLITLATESHINHAKQLFCSAAKAGNWKGSYALIAVDVAEEHLNWFKEVGVEVIVHSSPQIEAIGNLKREPSRLCKFEIFSSYFKKWDKVIYLDVDIIVAADINSLCEFEQFSAVPDNDNHILRHQFINPSLLNTDQKCSLYRELDEKFDLSKNSFNSGVLVFPTKIITENTREELISLFNRYHSIHQVADQATLNLYFHKIWQELPLVYNFFPTRTYFSYGPQISPLFGAIIYHFVGPNHQKPWEITSLYYPSYAANLALSSKISTLANCASEHTTQEWSPIKISFVSSYLKHAKFISKFLPSSFNSLWIAKSQLLNQNSIKDGFSSSFDLLKFFTFNVGRIVSSRFQSIFQRNKIVIGHLVSRFPKISETFIIDQISELKKISAYSNSIFATWPPNHGEIIHNDIETENLAKESSYTFDRAKIPDHQQKLLAYLLFPILILFFPIITTRLYSFCKAKRRPSFKFHRSIHRIIPFLYKPNLHCLFCHFGENGLFATLFSEIRLIKCNLVVAFYGYDISQQLRERPLEDYQAMFRKVDKFIVIAKFQRDVLAALGCPYHKIHVNYLGINLLAFNQKSRDKICIKAQTRILTVARLVEKKGHVFAAYALAKCKEELGDFKWILAGDGPLRGELEKLINQLGLSQNVEFLGDIVRSQIIEQFSEADIFLLPSITASNGDREGLPISILEAMAIGVPVISTWHSGIPEAIEDGVSGLLVPERDTAALEGAIKKMVKDISLRKTVVDNARRKVEQEFDSVNQIRKLYKVLAE